MPDAKMSSTVLITIPPIQILTKIFPIICSRVFKPLFVLLVLGFSTAFGEDPSYVLRPNDSITLAVYEEPDLSVQVRILKSGQASFPLIGSVMVGGLSVAEAAKEIKGRYAKDYLVDPKVTLTVNDYATEYISVIGAVRTPGQIPIPVSGNLDLAAAMATAGGPSEIADTRNIRLVRSSGSTGTYSMGQIQGASGKIRLNAGDRIIVNQSPYVGKKVTMLGEVRKAGPLPFPLDGRLDLVNAIALAGGMTDLANPKNVTVNRRGSVTKLNFKEISQRGDRPFILLPDDVVTVGERFF